MTLKECYSIIGNYDEVMKRLPRENMVMKFVFRFLDDKSFDQLMTNIEKADYKEAFMAAHTIKGVCQNLSLTRLYESSHLITDALRNENPDVKLISELAEKVREDYTVTVNTIKTFKAEQS